ncbi:MAG: ABC transporter permease, partial [Bacilli bacterium]
MLFDLSLRNVKRSFKDYAIYFLTLSFAVCLFYVFNSVEAQTALLQQTSGQKEMFEQLAKMLNGITLFISFVLAFLILFANQFLIKRRKTEFGTYMTLGMSRNHITRILIGETLLIGLLSLVAGLGLGVLASQGMAKFTATLFDVASNDFTFVFSWESLIKTAVYFVIIFTAVMIFNTFVIAKLELIDLIRSSKKNEKTLVTNTKTAGILFATSLFLIITGYVLLLSSAISQFILVAIAGALIVIGVFLFFFSVASFVLSIMLKRETLYFKQLNVFVVRQLTSKMNTTFVSMATISLMLTFTITILSSGFGYKHVSESSLKLVAPYDATITVMNWGDKEIDPVKALQKFEVDPSEYGNYFVIKEGHTETDARHTMAKYANNYFKDFLRDGIPIPMNVISQTDYVTAMNKQGKEPVAFKENEALILTNVPEFLDVVKDYTQHEKSITIDGHKLPLSSKGYDEMNYQTENVGRAHANVVVPDDFMNEVERTSHIINIQYTGGTDEQLKTEN